MEEGSMVDNFRLLKSRSCDPDSKLCSGWVLLSIYRYRRSRSRLLGIDLHVPVRIIVMHAEI